MKYLFLILTSCIISGVIAAETSNLLKNPGFEEGEKYWAKWQSASSSERRLSEYGRNGKCAYLFSPAGEKASYSQKIAGLAPGETVRFAGWIRAEGKGEARLQLLAKKGTETILQKDAVFKGNKEWSLLELSMPVPEGCDTVIAALFVSGECKAWFDDLLLQRGTAPEKNVAMSAADPARINLEGNWRFFPGDSMNYAANGFDDSSWPHIKVPALWEQEGYPELEGFAWYRKSVAIPAEFHQKPLILELGAVSKADEAFFDGELIGSTGRFPPKFRGDTFGRRQYMIPAHLASEGVHTLAIRVNDGAIRQSGGIWKAPCFIRAALPEEYWVMRLETENTGRFFLPDEPVTFGFTFENRDPGTSEAPVFSGEVRTYSGKTIAVYEDMPLVSGRANLALEPLAEGFYRFTVRAEHRDGRTLSRDFTFGILPLAGGFPVSPKFGIACHLNRLSLMDLETTVDLAHRAGVGTIRTGFLWRDAEAKPGQWNWDRLDRTVEMVTSRGMELVPTLARPPGWASVDPLEQAGVTRKYGRRPQIPHWKRYASEIAARYRDRIGAWEIWNEPNLKSYWPPAPDSYEYFQILQAAHEAILAVQPDAKILTGGLTTHRFVASPDHAGEVFLDDLYFYSGSKPAFNTISFHPYPVMRKGIGNRSYEQQIGDFAERFKKSRDKYGDDAKIWYTEVGCPNLTRTIDADRQAESLAVIFCIAAADPDVERVHWYNFQDDGTNPDETEHNFGLVHQDFSPKPALFALHTFAKIINRAEFLERLEEPSGVVRYRFRNRSVIDVVWSDSPVTLALETVPAAIYNVTGEALEVKLEISIGPSPVYLVY